MSHYRYNLVEMWPTNKQKDEKDTEITELFSNGRGLEGLASKVKPSKRTSK